MAQITSEIGKGFVLKARKIEDSEITHASPCTRELFDLYIRQASFRDHKVGDRTICRGQWLTSYARIQDALHWTSGCRPVTYTRGQIEAATKWLRSRAMVTTAKTTDGMLITICNYSVYQDPNRYGRHTGNHDGDHTDATPYIGRKNGLRMVYRPDSVEFGLAKLLFDLIRERKPDFKEPDLQTWAKDIDLMARLDGRSPEHIEAVIRWSQADPFWQNNVLSAGKLREKFDQLELKKKASGHVPAESMTHDSTPEEADRLLKLVRPRP